RQSPGWLRWLIRNLPIVLFFLFAIIGMVAIYLAFNPTGGDAEMIAAAVGSGGELSAPLMKIVPEKPVRQRLTQSRRPIRVGVISGHRGFDSGAVCADGLTEAQVNETLANELVNNLQASGIRVELLDEFDERLNNYSGTAVISIHADSCAYINDLASGFKIAASQRTDSDQLFSCMAQAYQTATNLFYHANTITGDMVDYHAFGRIAPGTPAIIIEVGFLYLDRELLTTNSEPVVTGLTNGVMCYLDNQG
ncbi:MAG: N-acetylmuramoyl-L-alanine amidase, partial [Anaerolineae bacterium]